MKHIRIDRIACANVDLIEPLWDALKDHHQQRTTDYHEYYQQNTFAKRKAELLSKDRLAIFVAYDQQKPIGFCVVSAVDETHIHPDKPLLSELLGELDSLYLEQAYREHGLGMSLAVKGIEWLKDINVRSIRLSVGQGNERVISFYRKLGFRERSITMQLF